MARAWNLNCARLIPDATVMESPTARKQSPVTPPRQRSTCDPVPRKRNFTGIRRVKIQRSLKFPKGVRARIPVTSLRRHLERSGAISSTPSPSTSSLSILSIARETSTPVKNQQKITTYMRCLPRSHFSTKKKLAFEGLDRIPEEANADHTYDADDFNDNDTLEALSRISLSPIDDEIDELGYPPLASLLRPLASFESNSPPSSRSPTPPDAPHIRPLLSPCVPLSLSSPSLVPTPGPPIGPNRPTQEPSLSKWEYLPPLSLDLGGSSTSTRPLDRAQSRLQQSLRKANLDIRCGDPRQLFTKDISPTHPKPVHTKVPSHMTIEGRFDWDDV